MISQIRGEQIKYVVIGEVLSDPVAPQPGQTWMLKTNYVGSPIGLLLSLTYANYVTYQLSYKTFEGPIIRTTLG